MCERKSASTSKSITLYREYTKEEDNNNDSKEEREYGFLLHARKTVVTSHSNVNGIYSNNNRLTVKHYRFKVIFGDFFLFLLLLIPLVGFANFSQLLVE